MLVYWLTWMLISPAGPIFSSFSPEVDCSQCQYGLTQTTEHWVCRLHLHLIRVENGTPELGQNQEGSSSQSMKLSISPSSPKVWDFGLGN